MTEPLEKRLIYTRAIKNLGVIESKTNSSAVLIMEEKPFFFFDTRAEDFYTAFEKAERFNAIAKYKTDGYVFTPNNTIYNPQSDRVYDKKKRVLTKMPDICKWKPFEQQTVDLAYYVTSSRKFLSSGNKGQEFKGTNVFPFDSETQVDWFAPLFNRATQGTIMEFEPRKVMDRIYLTPIRIRYDKLYPNREDVAEDVWENINDPINIETLKGTDLTLVRKYHNRIKGKLLGDVEEGAHLIDIGSGRGGDIYKMNKFSKILCIEPDEKNLNGPNGLRERLKTYEKRDKFHILQCGGEDSDTIAKGVRDTFGDEFGTKPVYISMMLSLSFFWGFEDMLRGLLVTLKTIRNMAQRDVKFIFLTIEGERTLKLFSEYNNSIRFPPVSMDYNPTKEEVYINMPGTIVGEQTEYIVRLNELPFLLDAQVELLKDANEEKFLNKYEKQFTSMYVYGRYKF
jgi:hypothetical protein